jgi:hypothetical protein
MMRRAGVGVRPFEFISNGGGGETIPLRAKSFFDFLRGHHNEWILAKAAFRGLKKWKGPEIFRAFPKIYCKIRLDFFYNDGRGFTNFHATFAAQAFIHIYGNGLVVLQFEYPYRTSIHAIGIPSAFVRVHGYLKH